MKLEQISNKRILLAYLNWGRGHLSRCIGLIRRLETQGNTIVVAAPTEDVDILRSYFPTIQITHMSGYPFDFSGTGNFTSDLWRSRKDIFRFILKEQKCTEELLELLEIDLVLSDHRYGFYSTKVPSIFITHQVQLAVKWWQFPAQIVHKKLYSNFRYVWIMDTEKHSLAGYLSKNTLKNAKYIGHFSRFEINTRDKDLHLGVVNGPHPYNEQLLEKLTKNPTIDYIISPIPHQDPRVIQTTNWQEMDDYFYRAKKIYGYAGYTTMMDLKTLDCAGSLIPTPGQTEQHYLLQINEGYK